MDERSSGDDDRHEVEVPDSATAEEAAAIAAAIEAYLDEERAAEVESRDDWAGRRWTFAGRLADLTGRAARVPDGTPADAWTAASRADRF